MADKSEYEQRYDQYREYIKHEDGLINYRLTWNNTVQGFLFAAWGLVLKEPASISHAARLVALFVIPITGFLISVASLLGIGAAVRAVDALQGPWRHLQTSYPTPSAYGSGEPPPLPPVTGGGAGGPRWLGAAISSAVPIIIAGAWAAVFILTLMDGPTTVTKCAHETSSGCVGQRLEQDAPAGRDGRDGAPGRDGRDGRDGAPARDGRDGQTITRTVPATAAPKLCECRSADQPTR